MCLIVSCEEKTVLSDPKGKGKPAEICTALSIHDKKNPGMDTTCQKNSLKIRLRVAGYN